MRRIFFIVLLVGVLDCATRGQTLQANQTTFIGGELSPLIVARPDSPRYNTGCRTLENAMVIDVGIAARRPGTVYVATAPGAARLQPFVYDDNDVYVMEFSHELLRFYREVSGTPGLVADPNSGVVYTLATPWDGNDVFRLGIYQKGDVLYAVHPDYSPRKISRYGHTDWRIEDCNTLILDGPFKDENTDATVLIDPPAETTDCTGSEAYDANDVHIWFSADCAFDDLFGALNGWVADENANTWIRCTFSSPRAIVRLKVWPYLDANVDQQPRHCILQGSNDGVTWTKIKAIRWYGRAQGYNGDEFELGMAGSTEGYADVRFENSTSYAQYRLWITDNWGDPDYTQVNEIEMMEEDSGTYTTTGAIWTSGNVGALWKIRSPRTNSEVHPSFAAVAWGECIPIKGDWDVSSTGTWDGTLVLQRSYDYGYTWENVRTWQDAGEIVATGNEEDYNVLYRLNMTAMSAGTCKSSLSSRQGLQDGIIRITAYTDPNTVTAETLVDLGNREPTYRWSEGAWSDDEGYPEAVTGHQARLVYAKDLTMWWSATYKLETFETGTNDDDSFSFSLSQDRQNPILWLVGDKGQCLVAGTMGRVMEIQPFDETDGFTPTNPPKVQDSIATGSSRVVPALADELLLYASPAGKRIHELMYNNSTGSVQAPDLTLLASHILGTGVTQLAWQSQPYPYLWAVCNDGNVASLYYNRTYEIAAWSRQETDGAFTSVAVVPREEADDRVWFVVNRTINTGSVYYVEYLNDIDLNTEAKDAYYVDCGLTWSGGESAEITAITKANPGSVTLATWPAGLADGNNVRIAGVLGMTQINEGPNDGIYSADDCNSTDKTLTLDNPAGTANWNTSGYSTYTSGGTLIVVENTFGGLSHLESESVNYLGDGLYDPENGAETVSSGSVTVAEYVNHLSVGLPYTTTITPVSPELIGSGSGTIPFLKMVTGVYINVYNTAAGQYGIVGGTPANIRYPSDVIPGELFTGAPDILRRQAGPRQETGYTFEQTAPYPFVLKTVVTLYEVTQ